MLKVGEKLPQFESKNQEGEVVTSEKYLEKKLVVFFYPKANTPTCTVEACDISTNFMALQEAGYQVIGVSGDRVKSQKNFHKKFSFPYELIADETQDLIKKFGVWQEKTTFGKTYMGIVRTSFLFNEKGICTRVITDVKSKEATAQILAQSF